MGNIAARNKAKNGVKRNVLAGDKIAGGTFSRITKTGFGVILFAQFLSLDNVIC